jgi:hypothetical protein
MRLHGSVTPEMVMPLFFVGGWSAMITLISKFVYDRMLIPLCFHCQQFTDTF